MNNQELILSALTGKIVLLNFWPKDCVPCILEFSDLERIQEKFSDEVIILTLSADTKEALVDSFNNLPNGFKFKDLNAFQVPIIAGCKDLHDLFGVKKYPITLIIDQNGILISAEPYLYTYAEAISNYENLIWEINGLIK